MLDDLKYIHSRDASDALGIVSRQVAQIRRSVGTIGTPAGEPVSNVVYAGLGGSGLAGKLCRSWPALKEPFEVVSDYVLPEYVDSDTLVILASYSGNTEETLAAYIDAKNRGAQIAVVAAGGSLWDIAEAEGLVRALLPQVPEPRFAVLANYRSILDILAAYSLIDDERYAVRLEAAADVLQHSLAAWAPEVPTSRNPAKQLALECIGKSVVIYAGPRLFPAAYKWKIAFNENAKQVAWANYYPEFNHNEFVGWSKQPLQKPYAVIDLRGSCEDPRILKRFEVSERLLSGLRPAPEIVVPEGKTVLEQLLWLLAFGDFVTIYTGLLNGLDPTPVDLAAKLKSELAQS